MVKLNMNEVIMAKIKMVKIIIENFYHTKLEMVKLTMSK